MYTLQDIHFMQQQATELDLKCPAAFLTLQACELARIVNGYGPDDWPIALRRLVSWFYRKYPTPAAIHDLRYEFSDGRESSRFAADAEFSANLQIIWRSRYGWSRFINLLAWYDFFKLRSAAAAVRCGGRSAWQQSFFKRRQKGDQIYE